MFEFIGRGAAFNTKEGNTGVFLKNGSELFMIDCGSSTFGHLQRGILQGVEHIHVLMTHTHSDHIGSLGDLVLFGYYGMGEFSKPSVKVYAPDALNIKQYLELVGVLPNTYQLEELVVEQEYELPEFGFKVVPVSVKHTPELECFAYLFVNQSDEKTYYSGDANEIPENILRMLLNDEFEYFYQDTCKAHYPGNVHLSMQILEELVPRENREKVYCMHLDASFEVEEALNKGFKVVEVSK